MQYNLTSSVMSRFERALSFQVDDQVLTLGKANNEVCDILITPCQGGRLSGFDSDQASENHNKHLKKAVTR